MSSLPAWLVDVKQRLPQWIDQLAHSDGPGRYRFALCRAIRRINDLAERPSRSIIAL